MVFDKFQSPINIDTKKVSELMMRTPLRYQGYEALPDAVTIENTGDSGE